MISFGYHMTELDHLILITDAANTRRVKKRLHRLEVIKKIRPPSEFTSIEDHSLLEDNGSI